MVLVKIFGYLRSIANTSRLEVTGAKTLKEVFQKLKETLGDEFVNNVFTDFNSFKVKENIIILKNGRAVSNPNQPINENDTVAVMPFLSGGSKNTLVNILNSKS